MLIDRNKNELVIKAVEIMSVYKDISSAASLLGWDHETHMPANSGSHRADQVATLYALAHRELVSEQSKNLAEKIKESIDEVEGYEKDLLLLFVKDYEKAVKIPEALIKELAKEAACCLEEWKRAKREYSWKIFIDPLNKLLELKKREAECLGYEDNIYDAMLDQFEPGLKTKSLIPLFDNLKAKNKELIDKFTKHQPSQLKFERPFDAQKQMELAKEVTAALGFDYTCGRIDKSAHPFTVGLTPHDVRITTRTSSGNLFESLFAAIHETGHGIYEQSINCSLYRTFACDGASLGIHESQSLFWENMIGRSYPFSQYLLPILKKYFPDNFLFVKPVDLFKSLNVIKPNMIRIEADELTYIYHIILRVEIELELVNDNIRVKDIPDIWNSKMMKYLNIKPMNINEGALQDIHWATGSFGYFPAYLLGKLYGASFYKKLQNSLDIDDIVNKGEFHYIRLWMKENILKFGRLKLPADLVAPVLPHGLNTEDFIEYMNEKADLIASIQ